MLNKLYRLLGSPVKGVYVIWYRYIIPRRLTLKKNPAIYCWLGFNFSWDKEVEKEDFEDWIGI